MDTIINDVSVMGYLFRFNFQVVFFLYQSQKRLFETPKSLIHADIRDVLKDLQMLSASLLKMEPEPGLGTESDICTSGTELEPGLGTSSSNSGSRTEQDLNQDNSQFS